MAVSRVKNWAALEVLTADDLNAEFNNILNNGEDVPFPRTESADFDGQELILDQDADTSITADTDDQIDFKIGGADVVVMTATGITINGKQVLTTSSLQRAGLIGAIQAEVRSLRIQLAESQYNTWLGAQVFGG